MSNVLIQKDYFEVWVPAQLVEKSGDSPSDEGLIEGICSTALPDADGEIIDQGSMDFSYALKKGYLTHEHPAGALNLVGEPLEVIPTVIKGPDGKDVAATKLRGRIYAEDPLGGALLKKSRMLAKSSSTRALGFSIEGSLPKNWRGARGQGSVLKGVQVRSIAITDKPKNPESWWKPVAKGLEAALLNDTPVNAEWMEDAVWKAEAMGYPAQGEAAVGPGGISKLATQSLQGTKPSNASYGTGRMHDRLVTKILKKFNWLSWSQGEDLLKMINKR